MIKNYIKTAFRHLIKNKVVSTINVFGLAIGICAAVLIMQYVSYENSYDKFHDNYKNIYRIQYNFLQKGELKSSRASAVPAIGSELSSALLA